MSEKELKLTDLDYATGDHHLQMVKAALPTSTSAGREIFPCS